MLMSEVRSSTVFARRLSALAILSTAATFGLHAQAPQSQIAADDSATTQPSLLADSTARPLDLASVAGVNYGSSSTDSSLNDASSSAVATERLNLAGETQPPPRRRYGRPRYNDSAHNPDGSNKYAFVVGGGLTAPVGNTYHYLNTNYAFQVGAGRNFNKKFGVMVQFDYDRFGFNGQTLYNQQTLYNYYCSPAQAAAGTCIQVSGLDGSSHVWSFSLDPVYNFVSGEKWGAYGVVGVGFFHKTANFTVPETGEYFDPYYGPIEYSANETIDKYTSNAPGFDGGFGITYKPSRFAGERLFAEARYVFVDNSQRTGVTVYSPVSVLNTYAGSNAYPANSNRTTYLDFKAGIRF